MNAEATDTEIIFDQDGVRVTDRTVTTENGDVIRVADIQRIQVEYENREATKNGWISFVFGILGFAFLVWRDWPRDISLSGILVVEIPAIFFLILYLIAPATVKVLAHCNSGVIEVSKKVLKRGSAHFQDEQSERDKKSMQALAEAISKSMSRNTT